MGDKESAILLGVLLGVGIVAYCIRLIVRRRKYTYCPKCDGKTKVV